MLSYDDDLRAGEVRPTKGDGARVVDDAGDGARSQTFGDGERSRATLAPGHPL